MLLLSAVLTLSAALAGPPQSVLDPLERARRHAIVRDSPAVDFFEGGVLGNGAMGAILCTRPDAVLIHFGHNNVWDIRAEEIPMEKLGTFVGLWEKTRRGDTSWVREYNKIAAGPDSKRYPRPWPCGTLLLGFDRRDAELLGHTVHIDTGMAEVRFRVAGRLERLEVFADITRDRLWMRMVDAAGREIASPFLRIDLLAHGTEARGLDFVPAGVPGEVTDAMPTTRAESSDAISFRQELAALRSDPAKDRALRLTVRINGRVSKPSPKQPYQLPPANLVHNGPFVAGVQLDQGLARDLPGGVAELPSPSPETWRDAAQKARAAWRDYWRRSGIALDDRYLERVWYRNLYFFNTVARPGSMAPGLYGNWSLGDIGTMWHGEYVLDYNTQQAFWAAFSSNHVENNLPYVDMVHMLMPVGRRWARNFYLMPGVFFAQIHWPVETPSIPVPNWSYGNIVSPTPWTVQGLWWHYLYTMDREFLRERAFAPIREVVEFMNAFMRRADVRGPESPWKDTKFHIYPSQSPEIWNEQFGDPLYSGDGIVDLALTRFVFKAYLEACRVLDVRQQERKLMADIEEILANYPDYPTGESPRGGRVFLDVAGASPDAVYNTPNTLMTVFPGEEHGLHSPRETYELAANTWRHLQNEGGNDLVFLNLQGARLGLLDLEKFKRQLRYTELADGTFTDLVLQTGGRYNDRTPAFDYMRRMGIWIENFALPVVINECLLQSYNGELRLFPNWSAKSGNAAFETLRAAGAFLVSAEFKDGATQWIRVRSEAGGPLKLVNPWTGKVTVRRRAMEQQIEGARLQLATARGETLEFRPAR
jgi:hypothetical protein